ncbi:MAG: O-antigen ligase family protein [Crocinitomicaceae bacterium]|jgi:O-antigen ligase
MKPFWDRKEIFLGLSLGLIFSAAWLLQIPWLLLFSLIPIILYIGIFQTEALFLSIAFFTPLSVNIEDYTEGIGLFVPTEPLLLGLFLWFLFLHFHRPLMVMDFLKHPILLFLFGYLIWLLVSSMVSTHPWISLKFLLSKSWLFMPMLLWGVYFFSQKSSINSFLWLFTISSTVVISYTIFSHAQYAFGEKESHWVMWPFFKDHTIYGAIVALVIPFPLVLMKDKKSDLLAKGFLLLCFTIILIGLYFSYTRAAWLSVVAGCFVLFLVYFRIKLTYILSLFFVGVLILFFKYDTIQMELARNKQDHTTEAFDQRIKSAANVTTDASNLERINRWSCAIEMFKERPFFGFGPGTFAFEYARFQEPENKTIISTNFGNLGNAHSEYLGALSETGIIGFILFCGVVIFSMRASILLVIRSKEVSLETLPLAMGILFSLSTYFTHAFLNNFLDTDKAAVPIFGLIAMILVLERKLRVNPN